MARNGWEHYELEKEIAQSNLAQLLELYKREDAKYNSKCGELFNQFGKLTEEGKKAITVECELLDEARVKVALVIADKLTNVKR
jgi:hypothetical protein